MADVPMNAPGFHVDVEQLAARAKEFDGLVERAGTIAANLDRALDGADAAWGNDLAGQSFAAAHGGPAAEAAGQLRGLAGGLGGVRGTFADVAATFRAGEAEATEAVHDATVTE